MANKPTTELGTAAAALASALTMKTCKLGIGATSFIPYRVTSLGETLIPLMEPPTLDKADANKLRYDLLPPEWLENVAKVATYGANKYTDNGWKTVENGINRYYAAAMRHIQAWRGGEELDEESKLPHLAHAAWNCLALISLSKSQDKETA